MQKGRLVVNIDSGKSSACWDLTMEGTQLLSTACELCRARCMASAVMHATSGSVCLTLPDFDLWSWSTHQSLGHTWL